MQIVSAFPAMGKTKFNDHSEVKTVDFDSSSFS